MLVVSLLINVVLIILLVLAGVVINRMMINNNFCCYNKVAGEMAGPLLARRAKRGAMSILAIDVAGMGRMNSERGEVWVNTQIAGALAILRNLRETRLVCQKNSGDEFLLLLPQEDLLGVMAVVEKAFAQHQFSVYLGVVSYDHAKTWVENSDLAMEEVYKVKKLAK